MTDTRVFIDEVPHSSRGASSAHRWRKCKGSLNLIDKLIQDGKALRRSGEAAAEGTVAHTVFAAAMEDGTDAAEFLDMEFATGGWTFVVDQEMADGVQLMLDFVRGAVNENPSAKVYIEKALNSITDDDAFGTPDAIIVTPTKLVITDFKYGAGIVVEPWSDQNRYYGYLGIENYVDDPSKVDVELWIVQPRIPHPEGLVRKFTLKGDELVGWWFDELLPDMKATRDPNAMLVIGDHCRFCPAKQNCPALKQDTLEMVVDADPCHMTTEEVTEIMNRKGAIEKFLETVAAEAFRRALDGESIAGYKLVKKLSKRTNKETTILYDESGNPVVDEQGQPVVVRYQDAVLDTFGMDAYEEPKVKTIPQLEKLPGGQDFVSRWAYMPDNGLTLAPSSDKRTAIQRPMDRFANEEIV